ncbi:MAG: prepilin-type N-terminal cleavage/methylation domain-containing protein [Kastovskya adunca ATA6-11-RM4]|jgi:prepilin-type N-terminal cleavage/methylation domain-containing protein|nr:prepilin-type N-terminal cleavage/methylation domain-containing protein [Kastovskya adunca ATA6-11-RM4]
MKNIALLLNFIQKSQNRKIKHTESLPQSNAGFTLIELIVVVVMVGVLATIAAPSWLTFLNQRRASATNDFIFRQLQEAQNQAKKTKLSYSFSFKVEGDTPFVAVHRRDNASPQWQSLGKELGIKPGQVILGSNITTSTDGSVSKENNASSSLIYSTSGNAPVRTITFDYLGSLPPESDLDGNNNGTSEGLIIVTAVPRGSSSKEAIPSTRRCVKVSTLLGSIQTGRKISESGEVQCLP